MRKSNISNLKKYMRYNASLKGKSRALRFKQKHPTYFTDYAKKYREKQKLKQNSFTENF